MLLKAGGRHYDPIRRSQNVLRDGGGLVLAALPSGRKVWRMRYRNVAGRENVATHPVDYPRTSLAKARQWREELRDLLTNGGDPNAARRTAMAEKRSAAAATFGAAAAEWVEHKRVDWAPATTEKVISVLDRVLLPALCKRPVADITPQELLACLQRYELMGKRHMAHVARTYAGQIMRRAVIRGLRPDDPAAILRGALRPKNERPMAHLTDETELGGLLRAIDAYGGMVEVRLALQLLPLVFTRPAELRLACWGEIEVPAQLWTIPTARMKARRPHLVPLSTQATRVLADARLWLGREPRPDELIFPGRRRGRPLSENTLNVALVSLGYARERQTPHGFRHLASTWLHEQGWPTRVVEAQLAHADPNAIRARYNTAEYLGTRREMMQTWSDRLDALRRGDPPRAASSPPPQKVRSIYTVGLRLES